MLEIPKPEEAPRPDPVEALRRKGYRSEFAAVESWALCPHCGRRTARADLVPKATADSPDGSGVAWLAIECPLCHARGLVRAATESED